MPEMNLNLNGNNSPPPITKRKKNRIVKPPKPINHQPQQQFSFTSFPNLNHNLTDTSSYYSLFNHSLPSEPMSLPIYPISYPAYHPPMHYFNPGITDTEHMSLPPTINPEPLDSDSKRRFSDPGLNNNDSDGSSGCSLDAQILRRLMRQVDVLMESHRRLTREVTELRVEVGVLKQQCGNGRYGEREYEPGMLAEVVREVRDAARVREESMIARVKHMIEEKQMNMNQFHLVTEKNRNNDRIAKLEEQMKQMNISQNRSDETASQSFHSAIEDGANSTRQVLELEREALLLRRELQEARAKKEESDQKLIQLDKKLNAIIRQQHNIEPNASDDPKATEPFPGLIQGVAGVLPPKVTLSGPVTDL